MKDEAIQNRPPRWISVWLLIVAAWVLVMVVVGGITRLTDSGLSMVDWRPIMGAIPPLNQEQWDSTFQAYQQYPQYRECMPEMDLAHFKRIFFWEYFHRLLGRGIGLAFALPFFIGLALRQFSRPLASRLWVALLLGGAQGLLGWFMVMSGLVNQPTVSHYRLAAHLGLAIFLFCYLWSIWLEFCGRPPNPDQRGQGTRSIGKAVLTLLGVQILYGALVAGLDAGLVCNTWPGMFGRWIPPGFLSLHPAWLNLLQNPVAVQWVHRNLAYVLILLICWYSFRLWRSGCPLLRKRALGLLGLTLSQGVLGVVLLIGYLPIVPAVIHQLVPCFMLALCLFIRKQTAPAGQPG